MTTIKTVKANLKFILANQPWACAALFGAGAVFGLILTSLGS